MDQIDRPDWVRFTCIGFGLNALFLFVIVILDAFHPFGFYLERLGFSRLTSVQLIVTVLIYMVLSMIGLWYGKKWGLALSFLFTLTLAVVGLTSLVLAWFGKSPYNWTFSFFLFFGGTRWSWELWKLRQNLFFRPKEQ